MTQHYLGGVSLLLGASVQAWCSIQNDLALCGQGTCIPANKSLSEGIKSSRGSPEGISSSSWLLGWQERASEVSPIVQEAAVTYPHLLPVDHMSSLIKLPLSSRKSPFHDLIQPEWLDLKTIPFCGSLPSLSWRWGGEAAYRSLDLK